MNLVKKDDVISNVKSILAKGIVKLGERHEFNRRNCKRYASTEMVEIFSQERRALLWRDLWIALAEAENELGLPVSEAQIDELKKNRKKINFEAVEKYEAKVRHDVMAHVKAYGDVAPKAAGIIHLGATSAYVTDNADLVMMKEGMDLIVGKLATLISNLCDFAKRKKTSQPWRTHTFKLLSLPLLVNARACGFKIF
jgi:adenylosuccinate lyase